MSDDEDSYHYSDASDNDEPMASDQDEDFEYTDEEPEEPIDDMDANLENAYYNAKGLRDTTEINEALQAFENAITTEKEALQGKMGQWTFKSLKQMVKLRMSCGEFGEAQIVYKRLLVCISDPELDGVSPNAMEKGINGMLDRVSALFTSSAGAGSADKGTSASASATGSDASKGKPQDLARLVYDSTLSLFHPRHGTCPNERLWFKTNLKYGQLLYENYETNKLQSVIRDLLQTCDLEDSADIRSSSSSTNLMEIYALQIQLYSRLKDNKMLREIFTKAMRVHGGIPHPRTLALIQELGGKMHMASREYEFATTTFFQAFKSYDEAGDVARLRCLKYLVMASMLHASSINPFDSQEVRPYKNDPEIVAMTNLVDAFHSNDIKKFEKTLSKNGIMNDDFIREHVSDLLRTIRKQVLLEVVQPYTRISLDALSKELNGISIKDVESLLVPLILDGKLEGRIDQVKGVLIKTVNIGLVSNTEENPADESGHGSSDGKDGKSNEHENKIAQLGGNTVSVRTIDAIENLMVELEKLTTAVVSAATKGSGQVQGKTEGLSVRRN